MPDPLVSVVIPAYNPATFLLEAIASAAAQTYTRTEIILVNDGSDNAESRAILDQASHLVSAYIEQPNRGLGAARNAGFRAAQGEYVVPLDADDLLDAAYVAECVAALHGSDAAFAYAALIRKRDWEAAGGYNEPMKGYEDWEFWLRLGAQGRFGRYVQKPLFRYRRDGESMYDSALARHQELVAYIRGLHPELYAYENRARIKARWSPAVSIVAVQAPDNQTIEDVEVIAPGKSPLAPAVVSAIDVVLEPEAAELAALAHC